MITRAPKKKSATKFIGQAESEPAGRRRLVPVTVNFDIEFLERVDRVAKQMGLNRSAWLINAAAEKLHHLNVR